MKKFDNFEQPKKAVNMAEEDEFRAMIYEMLSHKMLAMPYAKGNDDAGVILSEFSQVENPELLWRGKFRLFSSLDGTHNKDASLVGCIMLKNGETKKAARLDRLPRMISIKDVNSDKDVFGLQRCGVHEFYVPFERSKHNSYVFTPNTSFSKVIDCLSYDLYPNFLDKFGFEDSEWRRGEFLRLLESANAMEFVKREDEQGSMNVHQNSDGQRANFEKDQLYKKFYAVFYTLEPLENSATIQKVKGKNDHFEALVARSQQKAQERLATKHNSTILPSVEESNDKNL